MKSPRTFSCAFAICILAGGLSQRMGRDKTKLRLGGRTMLGQIRATAKSLGLPVRVIRHDVVPRCGPLGGILTAFKRTRAEAILFLACDMPFVSAALAREFLCRFRCEQTALFAMHQNKAGFPFVLHRTALSLVEKQMERGELSLKALAKAAHANFLRPPRRFAIELQTANTPEEWETIRQLWRSRLYRP